MTQRMNDERHTSNRKPIWDKVFTAMTWTNGASGAQSDATLDVNGIMKVAILSFPTNTGGKTVILSFVDQDGYEIYSSGEKSASTHVLAITVPVKGTAGDITAIITPNGDPGASGLTVNFKVYGT